MKTLLSLKTFSYQIYHSSFSEIFPLSFSSLETFPALEFALGSSWSFMICVSLKGDVMMRRRRQQVSRMSPLAGDGMTERLCFYQKNYSAAF